MKRQLLATTMEPELIRAFGIKAAEEGRTKAALLRVLVNKYILANAKPKGGNFRKGGRV